MLLDSLTTCFNEYVLALSAIFKRALMVNYDYLCPVLLTVGFDVLFKPFFIALATRCYVFVFFSPLQS